MLCWSIYSMLRSTLTVKGNVDIASFNKLRAFLKRNSEGYVAKKSKILTNEQIHEFLNDAPDDVYLLTKTDYSRHFDEIAREMERACLEVIQIFLVEGKNEIALKLMQHWEAYRQLSESSGSSMNEDLKIFQRKIIKLEKILQFFGNEHIEFNSKHFEQRLKKISMAITQEGSLNAGGKFEWVDSILIKCLQNGSWLLVDNVNLCSSAVLDRLNALLEPNGVLTVSERGVDSAGRMIEIKPHRDFRLFLTMDPKNGEISRAMRNRGIEIYFLNENELQQSQNIDKNSLIELEGLDSFHAEILIKLNNFISELLIGEKPNINELIQTSTLISQQLKYGVDNKEAFTNTILEVYFKTRSKNEFNCVDFPTLIGEKIVSLLSEGTNSSSTIINENATLRTLKVSTNSSIEKVKQQSLLLFNNLETKIKTLYDINLEIGYQLLCFYSITSLEDLNIRHIYLKERIINNIKLSEKVKDVLINFTDELYRFLRSSNKMNLNLPLDQNWTPEIYQETTNLKTNPTILLLCYNIFSYLDKIQLINKSDGIIEQEEGKLVFKKLKSTIGMTLFQYANMVQEKVIVTEASNFIINLITQDYRDLSNEYDKLFPLAISAKENINNKEVVNVLYMIFWKFKVFEIFHYILSKDQIKLQNVFRELCIIYRWFVKSSVKNFYALIETPIPDSLDRILTKISTSISSSKYGQEFSVIYKLGKNFQNSTKRPPPFTHIHQYEVVQEFNTINEQYDTSRKGNDMVKIFNSFKNYKEIRNALLNFKTSLLYDFSDVEEKRKLFAIINECNTIINSNNEALTLKNYTTVELQLLPIFDIFAHLETRKNICVDGEISLINNDLVPIALSGVISLYKVTKDERLFHEIYKSYYLYLIHSPSVRASRFFGEEEDIEVNEFGPKLTYFLSKMLVNEKDQTSVEKMTLGNYKNLKMQQDVLSLMLWGNMYQLSDEKYSFMYCEKKNIIGIYKKFLSQLAESLKLENTGTPQILTQQILMSLQKLENSDTKNEISLLSEKIKNLLTHFEKFNNITEFNDMLIHISSFYQMISYLKAKLNSNLPLIDPLAKKTLKRKCCSDAIGMFKMLKVCYENLNDIYSGRKKTRHAYCDPIEEMLNELEVKYQELGKYVAYRPDDVSYQSVCDAINHAFSTIFADDFIVEVDDNNREQIVKEKISKVASYENFIHEFSQFRIGFPDIVEPLLSNVSEFLYGFKLYIGALKMKDLNLKQSEALAKDTFSNIIVSLVRFPILDGDYERDLTNTTKVVKYCLEENQQQQERFRLLKSTLFESVNSCIINSKTYNSLSRKEFTRFNTLLNSFISSYNKQQEENEKKKQEEESLYKIKTKGDEKSEEELIKEDLHKLFPNYHTIDFSDFQDSTDIDTSPEIEATYEEVISYNDLRDITQLHVELTKSFTKTEWLNPSKDNHPSPDYILPLSEKFITFSKILEKTIDSLDYRVDEELMGGLNVILGAKKEFTLSNLVYSSSRRNKSRYDFYRDSNVEEVKYSSIVLFKLKNRINELLLQWPDQPTLKTIVTVIDRILTFNITSPISRFLTGFEILLNKCHEWEEVAHSGVSLTEDIQELTNKIISWRKFELSMWKDLLNNVYNRLNETLPKWWIHLFNVMQQFVSEKKFGEQELIETLQTFVTKSNLAEYEGRLDLLYAFHCHATYLERTKETESFINILWNIYSYFNQFSDVVLKKIKDLRSPIEKKLKDFVKIVRWKDINYWAIRDTVEKSHKTLHKFMREFKEVLEQPVLPCLQNFTSESDSQAPGISYSALSISLENEFKVPYILHPVEHESEPQHNLIKKLNRHGNRVSDYSKYIIKATSYLKLSQELDSFVVNVIETSNHLRNLEVDSTLPKEKQKSQAKNILQQKHRALADLFRNLSTIGLSYRTGIVDSKIKDPTSDFVIKPIDLKSEFSQENYGYKEDDILSVWNSSEKYYVRSLMRLDTLDTALTNPAKELGLHNVERLKGFSQNMLTVIQVQKTNLVETSRIYYYLRYYTKHIQQFCDGKEYLPSTVIDSILDLLTNIKTTATQYQIILNTCPIQDIANFDTPVPILKSDLEKRIIFKDDELWCKAKDIINDIKTTCNKCIMQLSATKSLYPSVECDLLDKKYVALSDRNEINNSLENIKEVLINLRNIFGNIVLTRSLTVLEEKIDVILNTINTPITHETYFETKENYDFEKEIEILSNTVVTNIKSIKKKYKDVNIVLPEEDKDKLKEEHLKKLLVENLSHDISNLDMKNIYEKTRKLACHLMCTPLENVEEKKTLIRAIWPHLMQSVQLYRYYITQQVAVYRLSCKMASILLNIFIELASKGFCIPPEFSEEFDKEGISKPSDGLGLGEGQGERDVSDKIESEDQLDDAQPAGKEKDKEDDKDCKEEEKGIEMSEDFDSKLQDKEKKDEDDSDSDSGDSDAEEQMGETEKGAEQQNKETFGDDQDEDDDKAEEDGGSDKKEEKGDKGEKEGEEQLGAKEGKTSKEEEDQNEGREEKEKDKKEINEMEEPEYDDEQIDPHHGQQQELPEPEPMDLPDDMQLDDGEANEEENKDQEENPFDIDTMKTDDKPDDNNEPTDENKEEESKKDDEKDFSSDDEDIERGNKNENEDKETGEDDKNKETEKLEEPGEPENEDDAESQNIEESALDQTQSHQENIEAMEVDSADAADKAQASKSENQQSNQPIDELQQEDRPDKEGVGQSQMEESISGHTAQTSTPQEIKTSKENKDREEQKRKQKPGETDSRRSLGDIDQPLKKKLKTVDSKTDEKNNTQDKNKEETADMYQHIKDAEKTKTQVLDVATKEQAESQKQETQHEESKDEEPAESATDIPEEDELEIMDVETTPTEQPEKTGEAKESKTKKQHPQGDVLEELQDIEIEGEVVETITVPRSTESFHHTRYDTILETSANRLSVEEVNNLRLDVEKQLSSWNEPPTTLEADQAWQKISSVTSSLAQDLSEQLRLVLEPTLASRLRGDFRTGRRINMRKVIPYIASQFRKDKIWLRRTKPSKREYQIVLAIDDSSSMADNHSKELAFESVALISKALSLLESGQLAVMSFGEHVEVVHKLTDQFTDRSGIKLLQKFKFDQSKTCVAKLVDFTTEMFNQTHLQSTALNAKLLVIVSDGRGVFSEGESFVRQAVRRAKLSNIFMVFVIIDNPENKNSVLDIRMPVFKDGKLQEIQNYMDVFPFSFYIILRDINSLPSVLSDALRQWFEIVSNLDK